MAEYTDITPMLQCTPGLQRQAWLSTAMITTAMATQSLEMLENGRSCMTSTTW